MLCPEHPRKPVAYPTSAYISQEGIMLVQSDTMSYVTIAYYQHFHGICRLGTDIWVMMSEKGFVRKT
jgi:hypothetical protein